MPNFTAAEVAQKLGAEIIGDASMALTGFAPADLAAPGDLTFAENREYLARAEQSGASAVLVGPGVTASVKTLLRVANPRIAFARVLPLFFPEQQPPAGIHPTAVVAASATVDPTAHVGPHCSVGERATIGPRTALLGGNHVGEEAHLGSETTLFPNVVVYRHCRIGNRVRIHSGTVIGSDGFGYVFDEGQHRKILQTGNVIVHDDVEIGANVCIDRGALGSTVIGRGTKIDNLVQIGHNVTIGEGCILVAQIGIAGSARLGNFTVVGGQAAIAGHIKVGNRVTIGGKSGVMHDVPDGEKLLGLPAGPDREMKRQWIALRRLPNLLHRVSELEARVAELLAATKKD